MKNVITVTKALADESRLRMLMYLSKKELCLCQVIDLMDLSPSTVSKHIAILHRAGLVSRRKDGRWHYYSLPKKNGNDVVRSSLKWLKKSLSEEKTIVDDMQDLKLVLRKGRDISCRQYKK